MVLTNRFKGLNESFSQLSPLSEKVPPARYTIIITHNSHFVKDILAAKAVSLD